MRGFNCLCYFVVFMAILAFVGVMIDGAVTGYQDGMAKIESERGK